MKDKRFPPEELQDQDNEYAFRPKKLKDFIGQASLKENLSLYIKAAQQRKEPLDHILLYGPPGLGKTTLAHIVASEMGSQITAVQAPALEKTGDMAAHLTSLSEGDVFFIDEIHRLKTAIEELLYSAMEDFQLDIVIGQGTGAKCIRLPLPRFTLVGATTKAGLLTSPFFARFGIVERLDLYSDVLLQEVVLRTATLMNLQMHHDAAHEIAKRSRGTPRIVNRIMRRIRDFAQIEGDGIISVAIAQLALQRLDIDDEGLDKMDKRLLELIIHQYKGGPVGIETLAISLGETADTIEDIYEPFLIQKGFIMRTPRGRIATPRCYTYFKLPAPDSELF